MDSLSGSPGKADSLVTTLGRWTLSISPVLLLLFCLTGCRTAQEHREDVAAMNITNMTLDQEPADNSDSEPEPIASHNAAKDTDSPLNFESGIYPVSKMDAETAATPGTKVGRNTVFNPAFNSLNASLANNSAIPGFFKLDPGLLRTLESMGAKSCVPDGLGGFWYPAQPVRKQSTDFGFTQSQFGVTLPLASSSSEALFGNFTFSNLAMNGSAILPKDHRRLSGSLWDIQGGVAYIKQIDPTWSCGVMLGGGTVTDKPFASIRDDTVSASAFVRMRQSKQTAWLFYVVSTTNGQVGHNIPIPGIAYEFRTPYCKGLIGFPFVDVNYKFTDELNLAVYYCALTDVQARLNYQPMKGLVFYQDFTWMYESWFLHDRTNTGLMLFRYEKHVEAGINWLFSKYVSLNVSAGFAFDRYFVENYGFSLHGKNEFRLGSTPYVAAQLLLQY